MGRWLTGLLGAGLLLVVLAPSGPAPAVQAAPLAQATATATTVPTATSTSTPTATPTATVTSTPTATPTPTLPPAHDYGDGWGVQALPRANLNCVYATGFDRGVFFSCAPGTPVP